MSITIIEGDRVTGEEQVHHEAIRFFSQTLGVYNQQRRDYVRINAVIERKLSEDQQDLLCLPVSPEEVKTALFSVSGKKAPGLDGYTARFFKRNWECVGL